MAGTLSLRMGVRGERLFRASPSPGFDGTRCEEGREQRNGESREKTERRTGTARAPPSWKRPAERGG